MVTRAIAARAIRSTMSSSLFLVKRPNIAKAVPQVLTRISIVSRICDQPGFITMSERVKIAKVISVIGRQIFNASHMVRMKEASAIRAETAAVSDVGGDN